MSLSLHHSSRAKQVVKSGLHQQLEHRVSPASHSGASTLFLASKKRLGFSSVHPPTPPPPFPASQQVWLLPRCYHQPCVWIAHLCFVSLAAFSSTCQRFYSEGPTAFGRDNQRAAAHAQSAPLLERKCPFYLTVCLGR